MKKNLHKKPNLIYSYNRKRKAYNRNYNYEIEENVVDEEPIVTTGLRRERYMRSCKKNSLILPELSQEVSSNTKVAQSGNDMESVIEHSGDDVDDSGTKM